MYRRALIPIALVAVAVMAAGGAALALLSDAEDNRLEPADTLFEVGDAGQVVVRAQEDRLVVADVQARRGWSYSVDSPDDGSIAVSFDNGFTRLEFGAHDDGDVVVGRIRIGRSTNGFEEPSRAPAQLPEQAQVSRPSVTATADKALLPEPAGPVDGRSSGAGQSADARAGEAEPIERPSDER